MTAEIAVMNKGAIALAADSKVTVTTGGITKTYDTVSKLFTLSKVAPVGIMVYGNADFMGFPWETIIKLYRRQKGGVTERTITNWGNDFFKFVRSFGAINRSDKDDNVESLLLSTLADLVRQFEEWATSVGLSHESEAHDQHLRNTIKKRAEFAMQQQPWASATAANTLIKRYGKQILAIVNGVLDGYSDDTKKEAVSLLAATLIMQASSPQASGVVIAGFGDDEYFPTLVEYQTEGYVGNSIKVWLVPPVIDVSRQFTACIRAFAQREMVQRFMEGIDPSYSTYLANAIPELVVDNCFDTLQKYGIKKNNTEEIKGKIRSAVDDAVSDFEKEAREYRQERFSDPVIRMVSVLPKDELAHLAESLVALTSLKRRVSSDAETVGGPVDVALISKGDGFIWIKRKHYFPNDLNPQFVRRYMDDVINGESYEQSHRASGNRRAATPRATRGRKPEAEGGGLDAQESN